MFISLSNVSVIDSELTLKLEVETNAATHLSP